ncbi:hypothetical protein M8J77_026074 [Diaphorina citri]|nr:hypothetical protein M8J77_026074 [Diaphorina citri]
MVTLPETNHAQHCPTDGWCKLLQHYMARIDPSVPDRCPRCSGSPHDVHHLFNCPDLPTILDPTALWTNPGAAPGPGDGDVVANANNNNNNNNNNIA